MLPLTNAPKCVLALRLLALRATECLRWMVSYFSSGRLTIGQA